MNKHPLTLLVLILLTSSILIAPGWAKKKNKKGKKTPAATAQKAEPKNTPTKRPTLPDSIKGHKFEYTLSDWEKSAGYYVARKILAMTNEERKKVGAQPLTWEKNLTRAAYYHSRDMLERDYFGHVCPDGFAHFDRAKFIAAEFCSTFTGENIHRYTIHQNTPKTQAELDALVTFFVDGWMNSEGHRKNMLNKDYDTMGVGVSLKGNMVRATQLLGRSFIIADKPFPAKLKKNEMHKLTGTLSRALINTKDLSAFLVWPDEERIFTCLDGKSQLFAWEEYKIELDGNRVTFNIKAGDIAGNYKFFIGGKEPFQVFDFQVE